jgi:hypothetical protein
MTVRFIGIAISALLLSAGAVCAQERQPEALGESPCEPGTPVEVCRAQAEAFMSDEGRRRAAEEARRAEEAYLAKLREEQAERERAAAEREAAQARRLVEMEAQAERAQAGRDREEASRRSIIVIDLGTSSGIPLRATGQSFAEAPLAEGPYSPARDSWEEWFWCDDIFAQVSFGKILLELPGANEGSRSYGPCLAYQARVRAAIAARFTITSEPDLSNACSVSTPYEIRPFPYAAGWWVRKPETSDRRIYQHFDGEGNAVTETEWRRARNTCPARPG